MGKSITDLSSVTTVGLDLAKHVFQVHGIDASGAWSWPRRQAQEAVGVLRFAAPVLVGLEACGSAHHWARELIKLGHDARMMPPAYVKPYVRRQKNDAADAAAICEAVTRPSMRFVARALAGEPGGADAPQGARDAGVATHAAAQRGARALGEVGVIAAQGPRHARELAGLVEACDETIPLKCARRWRRSSSIRTR